MKVILNQDIKNLGEEGDVCEVKPGYGRNFLIPRKLAVVYSTQNLAVLEGRRKLIEKRKEEKRQAALGLKERIEGITLKLVVPAGENGKLFGSVSNATLADELQKLGISIDRKRIEIPEHTIKNQGTYRTRVKLYDNQDATLVVEINPKEDKASAAN